MSKFTFGYENDKIVLRASQLLEELTCILKEKESVISPKTERKNINSDCWRNALTLRAKLKRLLCQRYLLYLKSGYKKLCNDDSALFKECCNGIESEKKKHNRLPKFGFNHLPEKYVIDVINLKILSEKLYNGSYKWLATKGSFQKIVNLTDTISNGRLLQIYCHSEEVRKQSYFPLYSLYATYLAIYTQCFCYFDPASISPMLISSISKSCHTFNTFLKKEGNFAFCRSCCRNTLNLHSYNYHPIEVDLRIILNFLPEFEASSAAMKITNALIGGTDKVMRECSKQYQINWIPIQVIRNKSFDANTSDYLSATLSETDLFYESRQKNSKLKEKTIAEVDKSVISAIESILVKNQALLLKYLIVDNNKQIEHAGNSGSGSTSESSDSVLERCESWKKRTPLVLDSSDDEIKYWKRFWQQTDVSLLKLLLNIPMHNCSDPLPGTVSVWTEDFAAVLVKLLKTASENEDIPIEGQICLKNMLFHIFSCISFIVWDKSFCTVLSASNKSYCSSVPMENGRFGTKPGYLFYTAFKPLLSGFYLDHCSASAELHLHKSIYGLMSMLDCFQNWVSTRLQSLLSSLDFSTCLIIGYCDVRHVSSLLKSVTSTNWAHNAEENLSSIHLFTWKKFVNKMNKVMDFNKDLPYFIQQRVESMILARLSISQRNFCPCKRIAYQSHYDVESFEEILELALKPIYETMSKLQHSGFDNWNAFEEAVLVVGDSYTNFINSKLSSCFKISSRELTIILNEIAQFKEWLENLDAMHSDESSMSREKITLVMQSLDSITQTTKRRGFRINKVTPV